jgi:hypothetical protein
LILLWGVFAKGMLMAKKLNASVSKANADVSHGLGATEFSVPVIGQKEQFPLACRLEIVAVDSGYSLQRYDQESRFCGDTWHQSIEEAKEQASFEFNTNEEDWVEEG